jgi:hypothetical protein
MGKALSCLILVLVAVPGCKANHDFKSGLRGSIEKYLSSKKTA